MHYIVHYILHYIAQVLELELTPEDNALILGSDGFWDVRRIRAMHTARILYVHAHAHADVAY